jgi:hypothetical protein
LTVKSGNLKRLSLIARHTLNTQNEKKRQSAGSATLQTEQNQDGPNNDGAEDDEHTSGPRQLYFNLPLPEELLDEEGHPAQQYTRNKIRTAKYTPLSFIPKNLWFQFQNIANIFFLFLVILVVSVFMSPPLVVTPTAYTLSDLPYIRWYKPRAQRRASNSYRRHYRDKRCRRRLPANNP